MVSVLCSLFRRLFSLTTVQVTWFRLKGQRSTLGLTAIRRQCLLDTIVFCATTFVMKREIFLWNAGICPIASKVGHVTLATPPLGSFIVPYVVLAIQCWSNA